MDNLILLFQLSPVWLIFAFGAGLSTFYLARLALYNPDVTWNRHKNPEPYQYYKDKQYKVSFLF